MGMRMRCNLEFKHCGKGENKKSIIDFWLTKFGANEDWTKAQRNDPILAKITEVKKRTNGLQKRYARKAHLQIKLGTT